MSTLELPDVIEEGTLLIGYGGWPGKLCPEGHQLGPGMSAVLVQAGPHDEDWHLAVCWCGKQQQIAKDDPDFLAAYAENGVEVKAKPEPVERVPLTTPRLVKNMAGKTQCPSGHKYHQSLHEGEPGSDYFVGVCGADPACETYYYPVPKSDPVVKDWLHYELHVCESCRKGEHTCLATFRRNGCNCPCLDYMLRSGEVSEGQAATRILLEKYGIEMPVIPELPVPDEELRASIELCLFQIEADRMRIRSMKLHDQNRPSFSSD